MDYAKYNEYLKRIFEKSSTFSKEVALKRDNKLIEGFVMKAEEEIIFNDFYDNGNENILKYSGVLRGLKDRNHIFFENIEPNMELRISSINEISIQMCSNHSDYSSLFELYRLGAEVCLYTQTEHQVNISNIDNGRLFQKIIDKSDKIAEKDVVSALDACQLNLLVAEGNVEIERIKEIDTLLNNPIFLKKQAAYATKDFYWMYGKGDLSSLTHLEKNNEFIKQIDIERKNKKNLIQSLFSKENEEDNKLVIA